LALVTWVVLYITILKQETQLLQRKCAKPIRLEKFLKLTLYHRW